MSSKEVILAALLQRIAVGDRRAMQALFESEREALFAFFRRLSGSCTEAEDLLQGTFLDLWRYRRAMRGVERATPYLYRVALNHWRRSRSREQRMHETYEHLARTRRIHVEPTTLDSLERAELRHRIWKAVEDLPLPQRETFLLHRLHDLSCRDIAEATGDSVKTVESRLRLAVQKLAERLRLSERRL